MKVWNYFYISLTLMLVLTLLGFETGFSPIFEIVGFNYVQSSGEIQNVTLTASSVYNVLFGGGDFSGILLAIAGAAGLGAVAIGLYTKASTENLILLPFITGTLVLFVGTLVSIMNYAVGTFPTWATATVVVILFPFTAGYILALAEFFRGSD